MPHCKVLPQNPPEPVTFLIWVQDGLVFKSSLSPPAALLPACEPPCVALPREESKQHLQETGSSSQQLQPKKSLYWSGASCREQRELLTLSRGSQSGLSFLRFCLLPAQLMGLNQIQDSRIRNILQWP